MSSIYATREKVIITDCDGVLLDWEYAFDVWMARHGYKISECNNYSVQIKYNLDVKDAQRLVLMFNESAWVRRLPPLRDAIKYVRKLHNDHGYVFHVITSMTDDEYAQHLRTKNLRELFGETIFERYVYLDCGAPKHNALSEYKDTGCFWVDDLEKNVIDGQNLGLESILMGHEHNVVDINNPTGIPRVQNWKDIYDRIIGNDTGSRFE